jgi:hypothetical protein
VARLTNLSLHLSAVQQSRWLDHRDERRWVERASAAEAEAMAPDDAEERQLKLARDLSNVISTSWYGFRCPLHEMAENVAKAVDPDGAVRPRPESAAWWRFGYLGDELPAATASCTSRGAGGARPRARRRRARADAPLADAVLLPLQELKRLIDHLMEVNSNNLRGRGGRERRRRRSAPPSRRTPAGEPLLRRSASMSSLNADGSYVAGCGGQWRRTRSRPRRQGRRRQGGRRSWSGRC